MIEALQLAKRFGTVRAVDGVSLRVNKGEIVGLLGPNGAGKTTTMRLLTGALLPDSGKASVNGFDVVEQSLQSRQVIGYLPENNPVYPDTTVQQHLDFMARVRGLGQQDAKDATHRVLEQLDIKNLYKRTIGTLSKGLKQRVGLAQVLLHDPPVLILDEPTSGLDPNQAQDVRAYIKNLCQDKAILWSTHILSEIEAIAHRVTIINGGKVAAEGTTKTLLASATGAVVVRAEVWVTEGANPHEGLRAMAGVKAVETFAPGKAGWHGVAIAAGDDFEGDLCDAVFELCRDKGWRLRHLSEQATRLEDVFRALTRKGGAP